MLKKDFIKGDSLIWIAVTLLFLLSLLTVFSSTGSLAIREQEGHNTFYLLKQFGILVLSFVCMYFAHRIPYRLYSRFAQFSLFFIVIPLLIYTLVQPSEINDAKRFLSFFGLITFQPSDIAKIVLIIYLARELSKRQKVIKNFKTGFLPVLLPVIGICALIFPEGLSTTGLLFFCCVITMIVGGVALKYIVSILGVAVVAVGLYVGVAYTFLDGNLGRLDTWVARFDRFTTPDDNTVRLTGSDLQAQQAKIAIAKGGLIGRGPGNSQQKNFLPHAYSDCIYAIIVEEYGFLGGVFVIILYLVIFHRAIIIVQNFPRDFGALMAFGLSFMIVIQAFAHILVSLNWMPVTGQPLPLVSMGGTSTLFTSIGVGIILSVSRTMEQNKAKKEEESKIKVEEAIA